MTLKVVLDEPKILKNILEAIPPNTSERILLAFTDGGLQLHAAIQGNVWAVEAFLAKDLFTEYTTVQDYSLQLNLKDLADFIKTVSAGDSLTIELEPSKGSVALVLLRNKMKRSIELRLLGEDANYQFMNIVQLQKKLEQGRPDPSDSSVMLTGGSLKLSNSVFADAIKNVELGGGHVTITMTETALIFTSKGTTSNAETSIDYNYENVSNVKKPNKPIASTFSIDYLKNISKFSRIQDEMLLCLANMTPALAIYVLDDEQGYVAIAIAPKST